MKEHLVTSEWIHAHKTGRGGWNSVQLACLGVAWPPDHGWIREIECSVIPDHFRSRFEAKGDLASVSKRQRRKLCKDLIAELSQWRGDPR